MSVVGGVWLSLQELCMSLYELSWDWVYLSWVSGGVQCQLPELSLSLPELCFRGSSVSGTRDVKDVNFNWYSYGSFQQSFNYPILIWQSGCDIWLFSIGIRNVVELIEYQLVEIQRESLVQGEFLVIPLFLLSKGEIFMLIHWQIWKAKVADLKSWDGWFENLR